MTSGCGELPPALGAVVSPVGAGSARWRESVESVRCGVSANALALVSSSEELGRACLPDSRSPSECTVPCNKARLFD